MDTSHPHPAHAQYTQGTRTQHTPSTHKAPALLAEGVRPPESGGAVVRSCGNVEAVRGVSHVKAEQRLVMADQRLDARTGAPIPQPQLARHRAADEQRRVSQPPDLYDSAWMHARMPQREGVQIPNTEAAVHPTRGCELHGVTEAGILHGGFVRSKLGEDLRRGRSTRWGGTRWGGTRWGRHEVGASCGGGWVGKGRDGKGWDGMGREGKGY